MILSNVEWHIMLSLGISSFKMGLYVFLNHQGLNPSEYLTKV